MPSASTPKQTPTSNHGRAVHQPFSWIDNAARDYPMADFVALTVDVCNGIHTCLEIFNSSALERTSNADAAPGDETLPAVTVCDAENLLRLSIAATRLLRASAEQHVSWINEHGPARLQAMKGGDE